MKKDSKDKWVCGRYVEEFKVDTEKSLKEVIERKIQDACLQKKYVVSVKNRTCT